MPRVRSRSRKDWSTTGTDGEAQRPVESHLTLHCLRPHPPEQVLARCARCATDALPQVAFSCCPKRRASGRAGRRSTVEAELRAILVGRLASGGDTCARLQVNGYRSRRLSSPKCPPHVTDHAFACSAPRCGHIVAPAPWRHGGRRATGQRPPWLNVCLRGCNNICASRRVAAT